MNFITQSKLSQEELLTIFNLLNIYILRNSFELTIGYKAKHTSNIKNNEWIDKDSFMLLARVRDFYRTFSYQEICDLYSKWILDFMNKGLSIYSENNSKDLSDEFYNFVYDNIHDNKALYCS